MVRFRQLLRGLGEFGTRIAHPHRAGRGAKLARAGDLLFPAPLASVLLAGAALLATPTPTRAQSYQLHQWANFEDGQIPADCVQFGVNFSNRVSVVEYAKLESPPEGLTHPKALKEVGKFGLALRADSTAKQGASLVGIAVGTVLSRSELGENGCALFQADIFIPPEGERIPALAVLAMSPMAKSTEQIRGFYRFGFTAGKQTYFSYLPKVIPKDFNFYKFNSSLAPKLPRAQWHRLAIVCQGAKTIRCYIDGIETSFSPVTEESIPELQVGISLSDVGYEYTCYADNLSVQYSPDVAPLPASPWIANWPAGLVDSVRKEQLAGAAKRLAADAAATPATPAAPAAGAAATAPTHTPAALVAIAPAPTASPAKRSPVKKHTPAPDEKPANSASPAAPAAGAPPTAPVAGGDIAAPEVSSPFDLTPTRTSAYGVAPIRWTDTEEGWQQSMQSGRPMLVAFLIPGVRPSERFLDLIANDAAAAAYINRHVPIRIDANQLQGGDLARKFRVLRLPTLLLLDSQGRELARAAVGPDDAWPAIEKQLTQTKH